MIVGFTGTQKGMTKVQAELVRTFLENSDVKEFHHGDCVGADAEAHDIALDVGIARIIHPPSDAKKRAWKSDGVILKPKPYIERNHDIVDAADILIATPKSDVEELRSGTWATVRYARRMKKPVHIITPDGSVP